MHADPLEIAVDQLAAPGVDLAGQKARPSFEDGDLEAKFIERVCGFEAEQPAAGHDSLAATLLLNIGPDRNGIAGFSHDEAPRATEAFDRRDRAAAAHGQDQPVEGQHFTGPQKDLPGGQVDPGGHGIEPSGYAVLVVPLLGQQEKALHSRATINQPKIPIRL